MTRRPVIVTLAVIASAAVLWWGFRVVEGPERVTYDAQGTVIARVPVAEANVPARARVATPDAPDAAVELPDDVDDDGYVGEVSEVSDAEIEATLALNAAFAKAHVARYCALAEILARAPLFTPMQGSRDATNEMTKLFGVAMDDPHTVDLPVKVRQRLMAGDDLGVTDDELSAIDFGWMRKMRDSDVMTGELSEAMPWGQRAYSPMTKMPYYFARLRVVRAAKQGDWEDTVTDIQALASLLHSSGGRGTDAEAARLLELELLTIEKVRATGAGAKIPEHLRLPTAEQVKLHGALVNDGFRFVTPGVDPDVQRQAFECAKRAGIECALASDAQVSSNDLRRIVDTEPQPFDRSACNAYRAKAIGRTVGYFGAAGINQRLRAESPLFGKLE